MEGVAFAPSCQREGVACWSRRGREALPQALGPKGFWGWSGNSRVYLRFIRKLVSY